MLSIKLDVSALREFATIVTLEVPRTSRVEQLADVVKDLKNVDVQEASSLHFWTRAGKRLQNKIQLRRTRLNDQPLLVAEVHNHCKCSSANDVPSPNNHIHKLDLQTSLQEEAVSSTCITQSTDVAGSCDLICELEDEVSDKMIGLEVSCDDDDSDDDIQIINVSGEITVSDQQIESFMIATFQSHHKKMSKYPSFELVMRRLEEAFPRHITNREKIVKQIYRKLKRSCPRQNIDLEVECVVGNYELTKDDFATLRNGCWLNDNIINAYMYLLSVADSTVYPFSTFFYPTLMNKGYKSVEKWTKKKNLFKYRLLLVPVHLDVHWTIAYIDVKGQIIEYYDSMGSENHACLVNLKQFMILEATKHQNSQSTLRKWKTSTVEGAVPRQTIGGDCGVFACQFARCLVARKPPEFYQIQMPRLRQEIRKDIHNGNVSL
ncbi:sentrin-specific protease 5-like isoform X2 [Antedon mediterranea]|uniref:sentrin-specific protease 5-like isoform X2 n=1 Tax=Antedon mediterranea TaxID=105859 RepID=UPI003AF43B3C